MTLFRSALAALALSAALAPATTALAEGPTGRVRTSALYSYGAGAADGHAFGGELAYDLYPGSIPLAFGMFQQLQFDTDESLRCASGLRVRYSLFAIDVGVAHRTATARYIESTGFQAAAQVMVGPVAAGVRVTVPLFETLASNPPTAQGTHGVEVAFTLAIGFDLHLHGARRPSCGCPHGRAANPAPVTPSYQPAPRGAVPTVAFSAPAF